MRFIEKAKMLGFDIVRLNSIQYINGEKYEDNYKTNNAILIKEGEVYITFEYIIYNEIKDQIIKLTDNNANTIKALRKTITQDTPDENKPIIELNIGEYYNIIKIESTLLYTDKDFNIKNAHIFYYENTNLILKLIRKDVDKSKIKTMQEMDEAGISLYYQFKYYDKGADKKYKIGVYALPLSLLEAKALNSKLKDFLNIKVIKEKNNKLVVYLSNIVKINIYLDKSIVEDNDCIFYISD